ncbi:hypothetical protein RED65_10249 [Oceanobacter sp. RED65]|uniref:Uncharacterized protein n=1 Tax=Bermanella marisrubri TaxID=207949 RepID=Q1N626_9GAMM|nr:hypothetical protein RED65_10249 [Oceanobacter sp. RED65] [Bermanella marisrubri]
MDFTWLITGLMSDTDTQSEVTVLILVFIFIVGISVLKLLNALNVPYVLEPKTWQVLARFF